MVGVCIPWVKHLGNITIDLDPEILNAREAVLQKHMFVVSFFDAMKMQFIDLSNVSLHVA